MADRARLIADEFKSLLGKAPIKADHIVGELLRCRSSARTDRSALLQLATAYIHVKA